MKLKEYLEAINKLAKRYPDSLEMKVIYSHDDEGNTFQQVNNLPTLCAVDNLNDRHLEVKEYLKETGVRTLNAIIIN